MEKFDKQNLQEIRVAEQEQIMREEFDTEKGLLDAVKRRKLKKSQFNVGFQDSKWILITLTKCKSGSSH
jgi:hypothetical protein